MATYDERFVGSRLDKHFLVTARDSTLSTELLAGLSMFLANSYLLVLVPELLSSVGVEPHASLFGFVVSTCLSSVFVGVVANIPVAMGPGVGCATYVSTNFLPTHDVFAMSACAVSGLVLFILSLANFPQKLFDCTPFSVRNAMPIGLGLYLALTGLFKLGVVAPDPGVGLATATLTVSSVAGLAGVLLMVYMEHLRSRWKFLLPITVITMVGWGTGLASWPSSVIAGVSPAAPPISSLAIGTWMVGPVVALVIIALFDVAGITYSCCAIAKIEKPDGSIPGAFWVFVASGAGSLLSAALSCTPVIVLGESFAGVLAGGRTGITAASMGIFFLLSLPFAPIFTAVPIFASSSVLVVLGAQLLALLPASVASGQLDFEDMMHGFPSFCTIVMMPFFVGIEKGIFSGLLAWACLQAIDLVWRKVLALAACVRAPRAAKRDEKVFERIKDDESSAEAGRPQLATNASPQIMGMPPRQNSFTSSPAPGNFPSPYLFRREAS